MARYRRRSILVLGIAQRGGRRGAVRTDIVPADHARLHAILLSKPDAVLTLFPELQIECLSQIEGWDELKAAHPEAIAIVMAVAATMGIRETFAALEVSDVDTGDAPGDGSGEQLECESRRIPSGGEDPILGVPGEERAP